MTKSRKPPMWRRAFLRALSQSASVTLAARHAGINRSTAYQLRNASPLFARLWDDALARGREAIADGHVPDAALGLTPRPLAIRASKHGKTCLLETGEGRWNDDVQESFIEHLAATANVNASAAHIGMSTAALYQRRKLWPAFRAACAEAKQMAVDRLDMHLLHVANNTLAPPEVPLPDLIPVSVDQAIRIVQLHGSEDRKNGTRKRHDWRRKRRDPQEVRASILRKLDLIERHGEQP